VSVQQRGEEHADVACRFRAGDHATGKSLAAHTPHLERTRERRVYRARFEAQMNGGLYRHSSKTDDLPIVQPVT
jgi:hypothetical protein